MALREMPFERHLPPTDSNAPTGLDSPLVDNFFKKALPRSQYQIQEINAHTVKHHSWNVESSTARRVGSELLVKQAGSIFTSAKEEIFEDGMESDFSVSLTEFIVSYGRSAMETIIPIILSEHTNTEVVSETLRVIGRINHETTYRDRLWLLERGLYSSSARVRDGAILGLAFLNDPLAIAPLKSAIEREQISELRHDMEQVLTQLEGNKNGISAKKDS